MVTHVVLCCLYTTYIKLLHMSKTMHSVRLFLVWMYGSLNDLQTHTGTREIVLITA